mgnify:CR=1 FL=1
MTTQAVLCNLDARGVAAITLNRPEVGNAYNSDMIQGLLAAMDGLQGNRELRCVVLSGKGRHFQAGADLTWIRAVSGASAEENVRVSQDRYRAGVSPSSDLLDAETRLLRVGLERTLAAANLQIARARLDRARGR